MRIKRSYNDLRLIKDFIQRFEYLKLGKDNADEYAFESKRYLNQILYKSEEWQSVKRQVIIRDNGMDLGCEDHPITGRVLVHHINPITYQDIINRRDIVFDMNNLITCSLDTHNAIHVGSNQLLQSDYIPRTPNDTAPWLCEKKIGDV